MPLMFAQLEGTNLRDRSQCISQVFPELRYAKGAIDYFLAYIVFPKEMKEFPHKLSASGWDIGKVKKHPTTGFSGTNDSRTVLPIAVKHLDLDEYKHTNALVLGYLLQQQNSVALVSPRASPSGSDAERLLEQIVNLDPPVESWGTMRRSGELHPAVKPRFTNSLDSQQEQLPEAKDCGRELDKNGGTFYTMSGDGRRKEQDTNWPSYRRLVTDEQEMPSEPGFSQEASEEDFGEDRLGFELLRGLGMKPHCEWCYQQVMRQNL